MTDKGFRVEFYDVRADEWCATETDAHRALGTSRGAIWWEPDSTTIGSRICRRDTNDTQDERDLRDAAWRLFYLEYV
jgi:hypothetical protein